MMKLSLLLIALSLALTACAPAPGLDKLDPTPTLTPGLDELDPTPAPGLDKLDPTPTPLKPLDLLDQATYASLTSYGFHFVDRGDGKIKIYYQNNSSHQTVLCYR